MKITKWNNSWKFWKNGDSFALVWNVPDIAKDITLPHDAMIEEPANPNSPNGGNTGYRDGDVYTYVKTLFLDGEDTGKRFVLKFEGIYMNAQVYVNGQLAGKNMLGYSVFYVELNRFLKYNGENEIRIHVRAGAMTNSRWYSGAGIYRDVYLLESGQVHIIPEGVQIKTENTDEEYGILQLSTEVKNHKSMNAELWVEQLILDDAGAVVAKDCTKALVFESEERMISQKIVVENPKLWSAETPTLHTCITKLYTKIGNEKVLVDECQSTFGIRTLRLDAKRGFCVNGKTVKLRGACIHHDSGLLGAATYEDAQYRQISKLKEAGFNAIRMSHHPMAPAMLRACDSIGMYVMDETFDMWNRCKSDYDYALYFEEWWERDVTAMIRKDYNHPSVVMYSVGNEIPEIGSGQGAKMCHELCAKIKTMDDTRFTLASINGVFAAGDGIDRVVADVAENLKSRGEDGGNVNSFMALMDDHMDEIVCHDIITDRLEMACASTDIAGYNYMTGRYEMDGKLYPNRVIVGSETYPPEIAKNWELVKKYPYLIGDFTWTGWDYIGEAGIGIPAYEWGEGGFGAKFPCQLAYCGDIDITGFRRPMSYFKEIVFGLRKDPYIAVQNPYKYGKHLIKTPWIASDAVASWTWKECENKPVVVEVYAGGSEVELFVNGTSVGRKASGPEAGYRVFFETTYMPGTVTAVVYDNGVECGRYELSTASDNCELVLKKENAYVPNQILQYVSVEMCDDKGVVSTGCQDEIEVTIDGDAKLIGFGSGNPKPNYNYNGSKTELFLGRAMLILMGGTPEMTTISVKTTRGKGATIKL